MHDAVTREQSLPRTRVSRLDRAKHVLRLPGA